MEGKEYFVDIHHRHATDIYNHQFGVGDDHQHYNIDNDSEIERLAPNMISWYIFSILLLYPK